MPARLGLCGKTAGKNLMPDQSATIDSGADVGAITLAGISKSFATTGGETLA